MRRKCKEEAVVGSEERKYTLFDQRQPLRRDNGSRIIYEANLVKIGEVSARSSSEALDIAKKNGLAEKPVIHGPETEAMRDIYHQRSFRGRHDED